MRISSLIFAIFALCNGAFGQGFINLNFEGSVIVASTPSGYGFNLGTANVPGWIAYNAWAASNYSGGTSLIYNNQPLDEPGVSLEGTNYWTPSIQGNYSIYLQGGSQWVPNTGGASIGQTGQIPLTALSITFWGSSWNGLAVTFNGQALAFVDINDNPNYTVWGADISTFAGQTGELLFTAPWQSGGLLDNIQFSTAAIPEPSELALFGLSALSLIISRRRI